MPVRPLPSVSTLRRRFDPRGNRPILRAVRSQLVSLAGVVGRPVVNQAGDQVGRLVDVITRWDLDDGYPPVSGIIVRVGRRRSFVPATHVAKFESDRVLLRSAKFDLRDFQPRPGEVSLATAVLDHELIDVDGVKVVRASDLYLAEIMGVWRLVGADVSLGTVLRRLGPASIRSRATPVRVIDWADVHAFGNKDTGMRLSVAARSLPKMRPGELADLLERLRREDRQALLESVDISTAADALEEMEPEQLSTLLRDTPTEKAAQILAEMEPDDAAEALRDLDEEERDELLAAMDDESASEVEELLARPEDEAGGFMTSAVVTGHPHESIATVRERIAEHVRHHGDIDGVIVVDAAGRLVDDVKIVELFLAQPDQRLDSLIGPPWPVTVGVDADESEVAEQILEARHSSVIVIDDDGRPVGRVFADDVLDALVTDGGRFRNLLRR
jgi:CBS domain-containing protein